MTSTVQRKAQPPWLDLTLFQVDGAAERLVVEPLRDAFARARAEVFAPHRHDFVELFLVSTGRARVRLEFAEIAVLGPCALLVPAGALHAWQAQPLPQLEGHVLRMPVSTVRVAVPNPGLASRVGASGMAGVLPLRAQDLLRTQILVRWLEEELARGLGHQSDIVVAQLALLLLELRRLSGPQLPPDSRQDERSLFERFVALVEIHHGQRWSVSRYAAELRIGRNRLGRIVQAYAGVSPGEVIQDRLMVEAKRIVAYEHARMGDVADLLGFSSQAAFCRAFRRATGQAPTTFRRRCRYAQLSPGATPPAARGPDQP